MYYSTEEKGCVSEKQKVTVKILVRPTAGFQWTLDYPRKVTCTPINTTDMTIEWIWGDGNTSTGNSGLHQYASEGTYNVMMIATSKTSGCKDTADIQVIVDHLGMKNNHKQIVNVFPNPVNQNAVLQIQGFNNATIQWFDLSGRMIHQTSLENGMTPIPTGITSGIYTLKGSSGQVEFHSKVQILD
jgi:PKD repeat protein